jgi:hypothetical protein
MNDVAVREPSPETLRLARKLQKRAIRRRKEADEDFAKFGGAASLNEFDRLDPQKRVSLPCVCVNEFFWRVFRAYFYAVLFDEAV